MVKRYREPVTERNRKGTKKVCFEELKFFDKTYSANVSSTVAGAEADPAGASACLNSIPQGDGESSRDGGTVVLRRVIVRGSVTSAGFPDQADVISSRLVRVALVWDRQTNGVQLDAEDVYLPATNVEHSHVNLEYEERFEILWEQEFVLDCAAAGKDGGATLSCNVTSHTFSFEKDVVIPVTFSGSGDDIANVVDNSLHIIAFANGSNARLNYESRVRFVD